MPAIQKAFYESCKKGPLTGSPVVGIKMVLQNGQTHPVDSSSLAFGIATKYAFTQAFKGASSIILEPVMTVEVSSPSEFQSGVLNSISKRKGTVIDMTTKNGIIY